MKVNYKGYNYELYGKFSKQTKRFFFILCEVSKEDVLDKIVYLCYYNYFVMMLFKKKKLLF